MKKNFIFCLTLLAVIYLSGTLLYYSQIYLLYDYFEESFISQVTSGWAYLAQALGILLFIILFIKVKVTGSRLFQTIITCMLLPVIAISLLVKNGTILLITVFFLNLMIGLQTSFCFTLISHLVNPNKYALTFSLAYSLGGIGTWLISIIDIQIMTSFKVLFIASVLTAITTTLILCYKKGEDFFSSYETEKGIEINIQKEHKEALRLSLVITLMGLITALGSNDPYLVEAGVKIDFLITRLFYAFGLIIAALIYDKNKMLGGIVALASLLYPLIVIMLHHELPTNKFILGLTDTFVAFYAVYRASSTMSIAKRSKKLLPFAAAGLCVSRIVEGTAFIIINTFPIKEVVTFIMAGILFIPLIIIFFYMNIPSKETKELDNNQSDLESDSMKLSLLSFAEKYNLTRRENEIAMLISDNKTNGEIAAILVLSESTVRFHVSNILKKTGMKGRNEVSREIKKHQV